MNGIIEFVTKNWLGISNFLIILVGLSAVWIYKAQEKSKTQDAASLIVLQIDELQIRMQEIQSYITEQGLNFSAFYESLLLIDTNYWGKYKHLFVRKMDNKSYNNINKFYQYILCIQEQQDLLHNLQKNYFFVKQKAISNMEFMYISETLQEVSQGIISTEQLQSLINSIPKDSDNEVNQQTISNILIQLKQKNPNIDIERFWTVYRNKQQIFLNITNGNSLTVYTPMQISTTIQAVLKQYGLLEITGTDGYKKLRKMANMTNK